MEKKDMLLVSVIVPCYNHAKYINECLNSIKNQTYKNIEIILIDDGSTDDSDMVIKKWIDNNPDCHISYLSQENHGVTKTLNKMINIAKGEYITLCASDDVLLENSVEIRLSYLQKHRNLKAVIGDANVIGTNSEFIEESAMKSLYSANYERLKTNIVVELVLNWSVVGPTFLADKSLYEQVGLYDESLQIEDKEFYLRLLSNNLLGFLPYNVAQYRIHSSNTSRKNKAAKFNIYYQVALSNIKHYESFNGVNKLFLKSHIVDFILAKDGYSIFNYYLINLFRLFRKVMAKFYIMFIGRFK